MIDKRKDPNGYALECIRLFVVDDSTAIFKASPSKTKELSDIAAYAIIDLLCIRYHREAFKNAPGYSMSYKELIEKV